ncbi:MAG: PTS transporter subunit EIIC [Oceanivirga sp.]|nr:PTS transporter subunit EIIC [Oceanivirga sp.]
MDVEKLGKEILEAVGGSKNVDRLTHCITRLRFNLKDESLADDKKVKSISGVMGVMNQSGQYQVIVGNNVDKVYDSILPSINQKDKSIKQDKKVGFFSRVIDAVSSILSPLIPPLAAAGMIKVILLILTQVNLLSKKSDTYIVLNMIAGAAFVFMPIAVAYCSSVKFKTNPVMSIVLAGVLLHPKFTGLIGKPDAALTVFGAPIMIVKYSATVLPAMMMVWFMSYVERFAEKVSPQVIKVFFKPLLIMLIVAPVTLVAIGPIGSIAGNGLASVFAVLQLKANWAAVALLSSVYSLLVMIGMHRALTPIGLSLFGSLGYEPLMKAASLCSNFSQASACLAVSLKTKNSNLKQVASSASATAFISGITEPAMYGVTLKLKRPLIACIISSGLAGLYAGFTMVKAYAYATPGLFSFAMFMGPDTNNIIHAIISALIAIVGAFVFTWILGFEDPIEEDGVVVEKKYIRKRRKTKC